MITAVAFGKKKVYGSKSQTDIIFSKRKCRIGGEGFGCGRCLDGHGMREKNEEDAEQS